MSNDSRTVLMFKRPSPLEYLLGLVAISVIFSFVAYPAGWTVPKAISLALWIWLVVKFFIVPFGLLTWHYFVRDGDMVDHSEKCDSDVYSSQYHPQAAFACYDDTTEYEECKSNYIDRISLIFLWPFNVVTCHKEPPQRTRGKGHQYR